MRITELIESVSYDDYSKTFDLKQRNCMESWYLSYTPAQYATLLILAEKYPDLDIDADYELTFYHRLGRVQIDKKGKIIHTVVVTHTRTLDIDEV